MAQLKDALAKKGGLTLAQLASYDDLITDALVDKVYFWTAIRKNRERYGGSRGINEDAITDILRKHVILEKDPAEAVVQLLQLPGLRNFSQRLSTPDEKEHFRRHLRRYVNMYMPDCPFEVTTTNRYLISTHEASITARRTINKGEEIRYLAGVQVALTKEQEENLDELKKDFSIVISARKKSRSLFLGPARFANHDCDANARLTTKGAHGMQIVSVKQIEPGDEITVSYGEDYFGDDNEECLCYTCEMRGVNGWGPQKEEASDDEEATPAAEDPVDGYSFRRKRKYGTESEDTSRAQSPASPNSNKRARLEVPSTPTSPLKSPPRNRRLEEPLREFTLKKAHSTSSLKQEFPVTSIEEPVGSLRVQSRSFRAIRNQQRDGLLTVTLDDASTSRSTSPQTSDNAGSPKSSQSTDATSVDDESITVKEAADKDTINVQPQIQVTTTTTITVEAATTCTTWSIWDDASSELSDLDDTQELNDILRQVVTRKRIKTPPIPRNTRSQSRRTETMRTATPLILDSTESTNYAPNQRRPGDYTRNPWLLCAKFSRWVQCRTCDADFVQEDAYLTRAECPRCERHSKLYGYAWPKTDREGKNDKEERVLDHRTIHRFVEPEEERAIRKGRKSLGLREVVSRTETETESWERSSLSESVEVVAVKRGRGRPRKRPREEEVAVATAVKRSRKTM